MSRVDLSKTPLNTPSFNNDCKNLGRHMTTPELTFDLSIAVIAVLTIFPI